MVNTKTCLFLQGYDDRSDDSDGDRTPPRASRRIPVTDLDEDDYNDPDYYQDNLKKNDTKAKVGMFYSKYNGSLGENCALAANQSVDCHATILFTISLNSAKV